MGFTPDKHDQHAFYFHVAQAYLRVTVTNRLEIQLLAREHWPHPLDRKTQTATLKVLRTLEPVLGNCVNEWIEFVLKT